MKPITALVLACIPTFAVASQPDLERKLPSKLDSAIRVLEAVQDGFPAEDYFGVSGFIIRASWCEGAGRPIHRNLSIRQAIDLDRRLEANGGDLFAKADAGNSDDVDRVCGTVAKQDIR